MDESVPNTKLGVGHVIQAQNVFLYSTLNNAIQMVLRHPKTGQANREAAYLIHYKIRQPRLSVIISLFVLSLLSGYSCRCMYT